MSTRVFRPRANAKDIAKAVKSIATATVAERAITGELASTTHRANPSGAVAGLVGNEGGVVSEVINLESSGVRAPDRRPRHDADYHEA